ncbi:hypothetical protein [Brevibacillus sp. NRS-1366]|uniref:hypothetical protein n=1 Tax=Brevibacillus sp. NRS-1366 TaxID=3233899 RepID=UPI003D19AC34
MVTIKESVKFEWYETYAGYKDFQVLNMKCNNIFHLVVIGYNDDYDLEIKTFVPHVGKNKINFVDGLPSYIYNKLVRSLFNEFSVLIKEREACEEYDSFMTEEVFEKTYEQWITDYVAFCNEGMNEYGYDE